MNEYFDKINFVKEKFLLYLNTIFKVYGGELLLRLEDYNLLSNSNNCIESSTAVGYLMEEFVVSKLELYTREHDGESEIKIERVCDHGTQKTSYDCFVRYAGILFMINIKADKSGNAGVAAINMLHRDYAISEPETEKSYIVAKIHYGFGESKQDGERKIKITKTDAYALEEIDFSNGYTQDYRKWSAEFKSASGRLKIYDNFRRANRASDDDISYERTREFIIMMHGSNNA